MPKTLHVLVYEVGVAGSHTQRGAVNLERTTVQAVDDPDSCKANQDILVTYPSRQQSFHNPPCTLCKKDRAPSISSKLQAVDDPD